MNESSPLFIHYSDNLILMLVFHPLSRENYSSWKKAMKMVFLGKNKFSFVDGSIPKPTTRFVTHSLWHHNNNIVASWLLNSLSKEM